MGKSVIKGNPTFGFISQESIDKVDGVQERRVESQEQTFVSTVNEGGRIDRRYRPDPKEIEVKTRRVQLVFQPSIYEAAKAKAAEEGLSLNGYIHKLIAEDTKEK